MMEHFSQHHDQLLFAIAGLCLLLEMGVLGMSGPLLFLALSCLVTGVLSNLGIISGWEAEIFFVGALSAISAAVLWKPLKKFQNAKEQPNTSSDMIGRQLPVTFAVTQDQGRVSYSGIEWQARLETSNLNEIPLAARAEVVAVDGSLLIVKPL